MQNPFRYFNSLLEVIRLVVMMYVRYPLSLRQVEDLLFERGIDFCHATVRFSQPCKCPGAPDCSRHDIDLAFQYKVYLMNCRQPAPFANHDVPARAVRLSSGPVRGLISNMSVKTSC